MFSTCPYNSKKGVSVTVGLEFVFKIICVWVCTVIIYSCHGSFIVTKNNAKSSFMTI